MGRGAVPERAALTFGYGVLCWWVFRGGRGLLTLIVIGNLANLSFLSSAVPGPESYLAGRPLLLVTVILVQIVVTLVLTGLLARRPPPAADTLEACRTDRGVAF